MSEEKKTEDEELWGAEDPNVLNPEGHKDPAPVEEEQEETPVEGETETPVEETPEGGAEEPQVAPETQEPDPRLEVARLTGEVQALRSIYAQAPKQPDITAPVDPVETLAGMPESQAMAKFSGLLAENKYIEAQTFWTDYRSALQIAPALRRHREALEGLQRVSAASQQAAAQAQVTQLATETKGEYLLYQDDMAKMITADQASQRLGNPPIFTSLKEVFELCKARKAMSGTTQAGGTNAAKRALAKSPGSGSGGAGTATAKGKAKALSPSDKALQETWDYNPPSL